MTFQKKLPTEPRSAQTAPLAMNVDPYAGDVVTVACKMPNGLVLQLQEKRSEQEQTPTGPQSIEIWRKTGQQYRVHGNRAPFGEAPPAEVAGGFALTHNVPRWFWEQWLAQNEGADYLTNGLIFAASASHAAGQASEKASILSGLEPLSPARRAIPGTDKSEPIDVRWPKSTRTAGGGVLSAVETGTRSAG